MTWLSCCVLVVERTRYPSMDTIPFYRCILVLSSKDISYTVGFRQSKTALFDWTFLRLDSSAPYRQSSPFCSFCARSRGGWCEEVLLYSRRNRLAALCFALSPRATARRTFVPASWWLWAQPKAAKATFVELHSAESRQNYSRRSRCWQHGIETARCCRRVIHAAAGERN